MRLFGNCRENGVPCLVQPHQCTFCRSDKDLCGPCQRLADAVNQVESAKRALQGALEHERQLRTEFNQRSDPFARLPVELVSRIFGMNIPRFDSSVQLEWAPDYNYAQITLGAVCQSWRHIIWTTPLFWRSLWVSLSQSTNLSNVKLVEEWLGRTADLELIMGIRIIKEDWEHTATMDVIDKFMDPLVEIMNSVAHRWAVLHAFIPGRYVKRLHVRTHGPPLRSLFLEQERFKFVENSADRDSAFDLGVDVSPSNVTISGFLLQSVRANWINLTRFGGVHLTTAECVEVIQNAPLLQDCRFNRMPSDRGVLRQLSLPFVHAGIKSIDVGDMPTRIFNAITLPSLERLNCDLGGEMFMLTLGPFVGRSACPIKTACFWESSGVDQDLIDFLHLIPTLEHLELTFGKIHRQFLFFLGSTTFRDSHTTPFLPNLQSFKYYSPKTFAWAALAAIFPTHPAQPNTTRRPLKHVVFTLYPPLPGAPPYLDQESLQQVLEMRNAGVQIEIKDEEEGHDVIEASIAHHNILAMDTS